MEKKFGLYILVFFSFVGWGGGDRNLVYIFDGV